jgi:DNA helicase-2/ATP-dependent DNA helicase PcrA
MFIWEKDTLNSEQENAIFDKGSVLLVACPGSGKTRTLTYKIAYELSRLKSTKQYVVAITYTNNAADEIKNRVELLGVETDQLWIGTIHSFCMEWILKPYHGYSERLKNGFKVINSHDTEEILTELCKPYKNEKITYWDCGVIAKTDKFYLTCRDKNKNKSLIKILSKYFEHLNINKQIDFEQILFYAYKLITNKPVIAQVLSKIFPFVLVDEYQDTKEIQYNIIAKIISAGKGQTKALIVGDPNQSIYDSLGGYPMDKKELEKLFECDITEYGLTKNYRSSAVIISYFDYFKTYNNVVVASGTNKEYPSIISYTSSVHVDDLIEEIAKLILHNVNDKGISPNEICIAAPQWVHLASITRRLIIRLPDFSFDGPGMAPFSRDIDNFWFKMSRIVLTEPSPHLYVRRLRWAKEVLHDLNTAGFDISKITNKYLLRLFNSISINETDGLTFLELFFSTMCEKLGLDLTFYPLLMEHHASFFDSSKSRIERLIKEGNPAIGGIDNFRKVFRQKDGITVSTIHGVKGEEYDTMIGFALLDDYVPHFSDPRGDINSKKLLYVLASRARKNLHLISEKGRNVHPVHAPSGKGPTPQLKQYKYIYNK